MTYASLDQLVERYGEELLLTLADRASSPAGMVDRLIVERALVGADSVVNASLAVRYRLPLAEVPDVVLDCALAIAIYKLHRYSPEDKIKDEYNQALKDLGDLAKGAKKLDLAGVEPAGTGSGRVITIDRERPITPESMQGFI